MTRTWGMPWPAPALLVWSLSAFLHQALGLLLGLLPALVLALLPGLGSWRRRAIVALGFPLALGVAQFGLPPWAWAAALALALLAYPLRAWRDAPLFPTPVQALDDLPSILPLPPSARLLDAGCGTGDGLRALQRAYPLAEVAGVEHSRLWAAVAAWRCRGRAAVRRGDLWADDWGAHDLIYLFQRPETMPRAWAKFMAEARPGTWLVSLQFSVPQQAPQAVLNPHSRWPLYLYRRGDGAAPTAASTRRARRR